MFLRQMDDRRAFVFPIVLQRYLKVDKGNGAKGSKGKTEEGGDKIEACFHLETAFLIFKETVPAVFLKIYK